MEFLLILSIFFRGVCRSCICECGILKPCPNFPPRMELSICLRGKDFQFVQGDVKNVGYLFDM